MVETRSQAEGRPLKKAGAYDTDAYYAEKDMGYGDVGVDQEPDAGRTQADNRGADPDFTVTADEDRTATEEARRDVTDADMPLQEDVADLKAGADEQVQTRNRDDSDNIDIVPTSREDVEQQVGG
ncbi:hypothetical protein MNEG_5592 [Monoraphidium neglectum]|uniref:Uncharacterized protein n=1 Tax=Monoraphidium neglectum TaxID=145388 RepID=A0A0D2MH12_9CHLO|nr:hypothetical protein MNEG_5592 [Monoraphidium neglectum]KIZ02365.1 hypothetical protein MNEG_5592 [Monoraphidium neglectum]|eukprot:XP_013901384.1 hypothetical protein MNEG_5592 [Monoraphidium neglectum]